MLELGDKIGSWVQSELSPVTDGRSPFLPNDNAYFSLIGSDQKAKVWSYITTYVRSETTVRKIRKILAARDEAELIPDPSLSQLVSEFAIQPLDPKVEAEKINAAAAQVKQKSCINFKVIEEIYEVEKDIRETRDKIHRINQRRSALQPYIVRLDEKGRSLPSLVQASDQMLMPALESSEVDTDVNRTLYCIATFIMKHYKALNLSELVAKSDVSSYVSKYKEEPLRNIVSNMKKHATMSQLRTSLHVTSDKTDIVHQNSNILLHRLKMVHIDHALKHISLQKEASNISKQVETTLQQLEISKTDPSFDDKCKLFQLIAENQSLPEHIQHLEGILADRETLLDQLPLKQLLEELLQIQHIELMYTECFSAIARLIYENPTVHDLINNKLKLIDHYSNADLKDSITPLLSYDAKTFKFRLKLDVHSTLSYLNKTLAKPRNNIILPNTSAYTKPVTRYYEKKSYGLIRRLTMTPPFQNNGVILRRIYELQLKLQSSTKTLKTKSGNWKEFEPTYSHMLDEMQKMIEYLPGVNTEQGKAARNSSHAAVALQDWWYQRAQYIPRVIYNNKTLKMWIRILSVSSK